MTLREQLDQIDQWLCEPGGDELADVLSALRGPDDMNDNLKMRTTVPIRSKAFPKLAEADADPRSASTTKWMLCHPMKADTLYDHGDKDPWEMNHFETHARYAWRALQIATPAVCKHDWQEQPGEPPIDVCSSCGAIRS